LRPGRRKVLADVLKRWPLRLGLAHPRKAERLARLLRPQVGDVRQVELDVVKLAREHIARRKTSLGGASVQLGPGRRLTIGVVRRGCASTLPPRVEGDRLHRPDARTTLSDPDTRDGHPGDGDCHATT
jgi:hypothetical protein